MKRWILSQLIKWFPNDLVRFVEIELSIGALVTLAEAVKSAMPGSTISIKDNERQEIIIKVKGPDRTRVGEVKVSPAQVPLNVLIAATGGRQQFGTMPVSAAPLKLADQAEKVKTQQQIENEMLLPIKDVKLAMQAVGFALQKGWKLRLVQPDTSMVQFEREGVRVNVYWTAKGNYSVATSIEHPKRGQTQLYRRRISAPELQRLFTNPRQHTGKGYYKK